MIMDTINISLTEDQVKLVNTLTKDYQFANRSEFFRAILRLVFCRPEIITESNELILEPPATRSRGEILSSMKATGKYSSEFLRSLSQGLKESKYFLD
jgi:Arc/MetJ-type ribon-helix-helix transcriptional regulator